MKVCSRCGEGKTLDEFPLDPRRPDGRYPYCKPCKALYMRGWHPPGGRAARDRRINLLRKYGITVEEFDALLAAQGGGCAICGAVEPTGNHGSLVVDHDHESGKIRGILCGRCNTGLGSFHDDAALVAAALAYLSRT